MNRSAVLITFFLRTLLAAIFLTSLFLGIPSLEAARPYQALDPVALHLSANGPAQRLTLELPVIDGEPTTVELEPFTVWRENARIIVHGPGGKTETLAPPSTRLYKGRILGKDDSAVFLAVDQSGAVSGMIALSDRLFRVGRGVPQQVGRTRNPSVDAPLLVREFDTTDEIVRGARPFLCATDKLSIQTLRNPGDEEIQRRPRPHLNGANSASYGLNLAIETDTELYAALGSTSAVTAYITNLVGEASVIYQRDLRTSLTPGTLHIWSAGTDPWTIVPPADLSSALAEVGTYWHNNYSGVARSTVVMVSGKEFDAGIAWNDVLCDADFLCTDGSCGDSSLDGQYGGAYAFVGARPGPPSTTVPDPTLTVGGVPYGLPDTNDYWILLAFAHELGHNAAGPHTHCVELTALQKITYGVSRNYIDECFSGECFGGTPSVPPERGTIMSFCQNTLASGFRQSRYIFWAAGEPSVLIAPYFKTGLEQATPDAAITIGSDLACSAGRAASVPTTAGVTYAWTITNGTITAGQSTNSITFTPNASTVTVQVTLTNANGCSITDNATATTLCAVPSNVVATATSGTNVTVTWSTVSGAASYEVWRCTTVASCTIVGSPTGVSFGDTSASANTAYLYKVLSRIGGSPSAYSAPDLATTTVFTDSTLTQAVSPIKAVHFTELRTAVNAVRILAGLSAFSFTDPTLTSAISVKRDHLVELRTALEAARSTLSLSQWLYTRPTITAGVALVKAIDVTELRAGTQ